MEYLLLLCLNFVHCLTVTVIRSFHKQHDQYLQKHFILLSLDIMERYFSKSCFSLILSDALSQVIKTRDLKLLSMHGAFFFHIGTEPLSA